jgi:hypothetical protein
VTDLDAEPAAKAPPAHAAVSAGARMLYWGFPLMILAGLLIIAGLQPSDSSNDMHSELQLGWVLFGLSLPLVLIGCVAVGVRMGLHDRDR